VTVTVEASKNPRQGRQGPPISK